MTRPGRGTGRPHPAVARIRHAVRTSLTQLAAPGSARPLVLAAVSGGADSLALADALAFEAATASVCAGAVIVDHGLQPGSAQVAERAAATCRQRGLDLVEVERVEVSESGQGLEAAARAARYNALTGAAQRHGAAAVLLGHTRDDQAEQVLLGLTRGSGARSLSGMPERREIFVRPLLGISREDTRAACGAEGVPFWDDPMNEDEAFLRVRARRALNDLERDLGPGVAAALARSADQLRADANLLDDLAREARAGLGSGPDYDAAALRALPDAVRTRVWRSLLIGAGAPPGSTGSRHTDACDLLLTDWRGQGPVHVPGELRVKRSGGRVHITAGGPVE
ncbi:MAG: tRNA lysidine(34) synthetase TilS [Actinomycetia bacterium]|nr:tRNA lysidine(34) synthetase TilS [Actinomycetes bacterium]